MGILCESGLETFESQPPLHGGATFPLRIFRPRSQSPGSCSFKLRSHKMTQVDKAQGAECKGKPDMIMRCIVHDITISSPSTSLAQSTRKRGKKIRIPRKPATPTASSNTTTTISDRLDMKSGVWACLWRAQSAPPPRISQCGNPRFPQLFPPSKCLASGLILSSDQRQSVAVLLTVKSHQVSRSHLSGNPHPGESIRKLGRADCTILHAVCCIVRSAFIPGG